MKIAWFRLVKATGCAACGFAAGYYGKDWIVNNEAAVSLIATVFSVLAGFLVAVMALIADERFVSRSQRVSHFERQNVRARLIRHKLLFQLYLIIMLLAFLVTLKLGLPERAGNAMHQIMLGLSVSAFLLSFSLPSQIMSEYLRKLTDAGSKS